VRTPVVLDGTNDIGIRQRSRPVLDRRTDAAIVDVEESRDP
jgi:hypothetical protein